MMSKYECIFLDRDGIINDVIIRDGIISSPRSLSEFKYRDDFLDFAKKVDADYYSLSVFKVSIVLLKCKLGIDIITDFPTLKRSFKTFSGL